MNFKKEKNGKIYLKDECAAGLLDTTVLPDHSNIDCINNNINCTNDNINCKLKILIVLIIILILS